MLEASITDMRGNIENQGDSQDTQVGLRRKVTHSPVSMPTAPNHLLQQSENSKPKRDQAFAKLLLSINGLIFLFLVLIAIVAPISLAATVLADGPGILITLMGLLGIDFLTLSVFLVTRITHKSFFRSKIALAAFTTWLVVGILLATCIRSQLTSPTQATNTNDPQTTQTIQSPIANENTCQAIWSTDHEKPPTDPIAVGTAVSDGSSTMEILQTIQNPTVVGDTPDTGSQYIEVDLLITGSIPSYSVALLPSSYPFCEVQSTGTVDWGHFSPLTDAAQPAKDVSIAGKQSIESANQTTGLTNSVTGQVYALYEVLPGDKGYLMWNNHDLALY